MTTLEVLALARDRGVLLAVRGGMIFPSGPPGSVNDALRRALKAHRREVVEAVGEGDVPDATLPDVLVIPASLPNTAEAVRACVDSQRVRQTARLFGS